ncbi:MAG: hypothetical protein IJF84_13200 [Thermoguttaceae bacterium]|nr:hypothetical protein [Thermoguttaceae bacterium]
MLLKNYKECVCKYYPQKQWERRADELFDTTEVRRLRLQELDILQQIIDSMEEEKQALSHAFFGLRDDFKTRLHPAVQKNALEIDARMNGLGRAINTIKGMKRKRQEQWR